MSIIQIQTGDSESDFIEVDVEVAKCSKMIEQCFKAIEGDNVESPVFTLYSTKGILEKIFEWATHHKDELSMINMDTELSEWDKEFLDNLRKEHTLFELVHVCRQLGIPALLDMCAKYVNSSTIVAGLKNTTLANIREAFDIGQPSSEDEKSDDMVCNEDNTPLSEESDNAMSVERSKDPLETVRDS
ncbi:hypothetical protein TSAR_001102 [Trichomalopsis sarcophagae]|uniref:SKP1 component POZ domain-containing protein n=1 Tax=Trichomalopsis sarcophagae TaxID=543379 RepID=A0A232F0R4_9HYME|nr:hypothetical protein TSAR_001102 [Trichomalopsis sarcophagae]